MSSNLGKDRRAFCAGQHRLEDTAGCVYRKRHPHCTDERIAAGWRR
jgi:hypothetical protein